MTWALGLLVTAKYDVPGGPAVVVVVLSVIPMTWFGSKLIRNPAEAVQLGTSW